jgi:hypothetical protein
VVAELNTRADAHIGGHVGREASCRNGAVAIGRCDTVVTSGEQAALSLKLQVVGQWLGDEIDEVLSDCKLVEANLNQQRRTALTNARKETVRLPRVASATGHSQSQSLANPQSQSQRAPGRSEEHQHGAMSGVFAKRGRIIKMPRMSPPAHSLGGKRLQAKHPLSSACDPEALSDRLPVPCSDTIRARRQR